MEEAPAEEPMEEAAPADGTGYSVAFVFDLFVEDGGWNTTHYRGRPAGAGGVPGPRRAGHRGDLSRPEPPPTRSRTWRRSGSRHDHRHRLLLHARRRCRSRPQYPDTKFLTWAGWTDRRQRRPLRRGHRGRPLPRRADRGERHRERHHRLPGRLPHRRGQPGPQRLHHRRARGQPPTPWCRSCTSTAGTTRRSSSRPQRRWPTRGADVLAHELNSPAVASVAERPRPQHHRLLAPTAPTSRTRMPGCRRSPSSGAPYYIDQVQTDDRRDLGARPHLRRPGQAGMIGNSPLRART